MKGLFFLLIGFAIVQTNAQRTVNEVLGDSAVKQHIRLTLTLTSDSASMVISGPSTHWFAIGFNAKRMQRGVDVVVVPSWKETLSEIDPYDAVLTGYAPPKRDEIQHWTVLNETLLQGRRTFHLMRALSTSDLEDYDFTNVAKSGGTLDILWAMGSEKGDKTEYHGNLKGKRVIVF
jgi:hypothetical protein